MLPFIYGGLAAAGTALIAALACRFLFTEVVRNRSALPIALASGFFVGYALLDNWVPLHKWAPLWPERYWHWLPYLAVIGAILGITTTSLHAFVRWPLQVVLYAFSAWALTPTWQSLEPPRYVFIPCATLGMLVLGILLEWLARHTTASLLVTCMAGCWLIAAAIITSEVSEQFGQVANLSAAALFGCAIATFYFGSTSGVSLVPAYVVLIGGTAFAAHLEPMPAVRGILLFPAVPLALAIGSIGTLGRLSAGKRLAIQMVFVLILLCVVVALCISG